MSEKLFYAGYGRVRSYRIPALAYTAEGTLIAAADARITEGCDNPNRIDKVIRRSHDGGRTWGEAVTALAMHGEGKKGSAAIDPCVLYDAQTKRLLMMYCYSPAGTGLVNANMGTGYTADGKKVLYDRQGNRYYAEAGKVRREAGGRPLYELAEDGTLLDHGTDKGNIQLSNTILREYPTCYLQYIYSGDEGKTWSAPCDITSMVKQPWMRFLGPGPGNAVIKRRGTAAGRYLFPVYYSNPYGLLSCAVVYSDDQGRHWQMGQSPNDTRCEEGSRLAFDSRLSLQEMQLVELDDGTVRAFIRNTGAEARIYYADSADGGITWSAPAVSSFLDNPVCMLSAIRLKEGRDRVLLCGPWDQKRRIRGTVFLSEDGGLSPEKACRITEGGFGYSSMVQLDADTIGLLYEADNGSPVVEQMRYLTISLTKDFRRI